MQEDLSKVFSLLLQPKSNEDIKLCENYLLQVFFSLKINKLKKHF